MITLKNIIAFELLRKHSFNSFDPSNLDDVYALAYCIDSRMKDNFTTFEESLRVAKENPDIMGEIIEEVGKALQYSAQFREVVDDKKADSEDKEQKEQKEQKDIYIKDIVGRLAFTGLDLNYLMEKCELHEVGFLVEALDKKTREQMELQRFWNFIQLSPHLDKKTTMRDLIEFPWEAGKPKEDASITEEEKRMAAEILNYKKD